ncbi:hypothetical protein [Clostridium sp. LCP25S3_F8]|uniref:hypothetical protein n=1 Tax=Clostridium sp. LCP25S3_F8 TaxID=3438751 RepID=UPI003F9177B8
MSMHLMGKIAWTVVNADAITSFLKCYIRIDISKLSLHASRQLHIGQNLLPQKLPLCSLKYSKFKSVNINKWSPHSEVLSTFFLVVKGAIYDVNLGFFNFLLVYFSKMFFTSCGGSLYILTCLIYYSLYEYCK